MKHLSIRARLKECADALLENHQNLPLTLRPYQIENLQKFKQWLDDSSGPHRCHNVQASGLGKTVEFAAITSFTTGLQTLIIVPSKILLEQTARVVVKFTSGLVGHLSSLRKIRNDDGEVIAVHGHQFQNIILTTDESFIRYADKLAAEFSPGLIIWDECHWGYTKAAQQALMYFPEAVIVGFTATPDYLTTVAKRNYLQVQLENGRQLYCPPNYKGTANFGTLIVERSMRWGIEEGWLAPFAWGQVEFDLPMGNALDELPLAFGPGGIDYKEGALQKLMARYWPLVNQTIVRLYESNQYELPQHQVVAICHSIKAAEQLAKNIHNLGVPAAIISGNTPDVERNAILAAYQANEINFLTSVMVLREGWDSYNADVCMMLRPTRSYVFYKQGMGRILRPDLAGGYKVALVLDAHFMYSRFTPLSAPVLFAEPQSKIIHNDLMIKRVRSICKGSFSRAPIETISPYLTADATPRLVIVPALEIEYWSGDDGMFEAEGEIWCHLSGLERKLKWTRRTIEEYLQKNPVRSRQEYDQKGRLTQFYCLREVEIACATLLASQLTVPRNGLVTVDGEIYGTLFKLKDQLGVSECGLNTRVKAAGNKLSIRKGKTTAGIRDLYCLSELREICKDLLLSCYKLRKDGTVIIKGENGHGELWGSVSGLARILKMRPSSVKDLVQQLKRLKRLGKHPRGRAIRIFPLDKVRQALHVKQNMPNPGSDGSFMADGEQWASRKAMAHFLQISEYRCLLYFTRLTRADLAKIRQRPGNNRWKHITFHCVADVKALYANSQKERL